MSEEIDALKTAAIGGILPSLGSLGVNSSATALSSVTGDIITGGAKKNDTGIPMFFWVGIAIFGAAILFKAVKK